MSKQYFLCLCLFLGACVHPAFQAIQGKNGDDVRALKGNPSTILTARDHEMWTYRYTDCTQIIFFDETKNAVDFHEIGSCPVAE